MKKLLGFCFVLLLSACMTAPQDIFSTQLDLGENLKLPVSKVEVVNMQKENDSAHYIEKKWPQTPFEIIQKWGDEKLKVLPKYNARLIVAVHQADVVREKLVASHWYQNDEIKDTLTYQVEFIIKQNHKTLYTQMVSGKSFAQLPVQSSLADKETEWVKMANEMIQGLSRQGIQKIENAL